MNVFRVNGFLKYGEWCHQKGDAIWLSVSTKQVNIYVSFSFLTATLECLHSKCTSVRLSNRLLAASVSLKTSYLRRTKEQQCIIVLPPPPRESPNNCVGADLTTHSGPRLDKHWLWSSQNCLFLVFIDRNLITEWFFFHKVLDWSDSNGVDSLIAITSAFQAGGRGINPRPVPLLYL